jgi:co-chaperonin GroES (HSP10)
LNSTVIAIPDHVRALELMREMRATVVQVGAAAWRDEPPRAEAGDHVLVGRFCGAIVKGPKDGNLYRIVNDKDIFCQIEGDMREVVIEDPVVKTKQLEQENERRESRTG